MPNESLKIACFHGVIPNSQKLQGIQNCQKKHITKFQFESYLKYLKIKKKVNFLSVKDIIKKDFKIKKNSYLITFDDGYKNNFTIATKILNKLKIPCIFFICPDMIGYNKIFTTDRIEHIINFSKKLKINHKNKKKIFKNLLKKDKLKNLIYVKKIVKNQISNEKKKFMIDLIKNNLVKEKFPSFYKIANWHEIKKSSNNMISIGNHFINHIELTNLSSKNLVKIINKSKKIFISHKLSSSFYYASYPEGKYNKKVIGVIKSKGIKICPTVGSGINKGKLNMYTLSRYMVGFDNNKLYF